MSSPSSAPVAAPAAKICFNAQCKESIADHIAPRRKGWRLRSGEIAELCDRCSYVLSSSPTLTVHLAVCLFKICFFPVYIVQKNGLGHSRFECSGAQIWFSSEPPRRRLFYLATFRSFWMSYQFIYCFTMTYMLNWSYIIATMWNCHRKKSLVWAGFCV